MANYSAYGLPEPPPELLKADIPQSHLLKMIALGGGGSSQEPTDDTEDAWVTPPVNDTDAGVAGQKAYDAKFFYIATATGTWRRTRLQRFGLGSHPFASDGTMAALFRGDSLDVLDGQEVNGWRDLTGNANNAAAHPMNGWKPLARLTGGPNGEAFVECVGNRYGLTFAPSAIVGGAATYTLVAVARHSTGAPATANAGVRALFGQWSNASSGGQLSVGGVSNGTVNKFGYVSSAGAVGQPADATTTPSGWRLFTWVYRTSGTTSFYLNGSLMGSLSLSWVSPQWLSILMPKDAVTFGSNAAPAWAAQNSIAELAAFPRELNAAEVASYYAYATARYGDLTL